MSLSFNTIAFTGNRLERLSETRHDDCVEVARHHNNYRLIIFADGLPVMRDSQLFFKPEEALDLAPRWQEAILLGTHEGCAVLAATSGVAISAPYQVIDMRALLSSGEVERASLGVLAQAASLLAWHRNNRFCARCGAATRMCGGGVRRVCNSCQAEHFPRTDPVAIMLVHDEERCLLARNVNFPARRFSCLAGFIEQGETFEAAVRREVREETGIKIGEVRYIASQPWPFPHSLMLGAFAHALDDSITIDDNEIAEAHWFSRRDVAEMMVGHHAQGFDLPPPGSIGNFLIRSFAEGEGR